MIGTIVSIAVTILALTAFAIMISKRVESEWFQTYKSAVFLGSAVLTVAFLGLPYMKYDTALNAPSFHFIVLGLTILFLLGAMFVYSATVSVDVYIMAASCIVILSTIFGQMGPTEISPYSQFNIILILVAATLFGTSKALQFIRVPVELQPLIQLFQSSVPILLWVFVAVAMFRGVRSLAESAAGQPAYKGQAYEPFQVALTRENSQPVQIVQETKKTQEAPVRAIESPQEVGTTVPVLLQQVEKAIQRIEDNTERMLDMADSTCSIVNEIEQGYVVAKAAPEEEEYDLPVQEQNRRNEARKVRLKKNFADARRIFSSLRTTAPILECYQDFNELRVACKELEEHLQNQEVLNQMQTNLQVEIALEFSNKMFDRTEGFQSNGTSTVAWDTLEGPALISAAQALLLQELNWNTKLLQNEKTLQTLQARRKYLLQKAGMVQKGNYSSFPTKQ